MSIILGATYPDIFAAIGVHSGIEYQAVTNSISALKMMRHGRPNPIQQGQKAFYGKPQTSSAFDCFSRHA